MKKSEKLEAVTPVERPSWSDTLEEHPFIHWVTENRKNIIYALLGLVVLGIILYRFVNSSNAASETDFINADKDYLLFIKEGDPSVQADALKTLNTILAAHPELHPKYDGSIAETLLIRHQTALAADYAQPAIQRTKEENDPFYKSYAQTTLAIADSKFEEALKESKTLKEQMVKQGEELKNNPEKIQFSSLLYAINLLRIGLLQQQLALHEEELKTWQEWKDLIHKSQENSLPNFLDGSLLLSFESLLGEGNTTFANYIDAREKILTRRG